MLFTVKGMRETNILVAKGLYHDKFSLVSLESLFYCLKSTGRFQTQNAN